ncbi:carbohydrate-binding protein [Massilia sp. H-1]|nr:carbohydrate-binding protein [Massilia sp. H-1]
MSAVAAVPNTGGWQNWTTVASRVYLNAGPQQLAVYAKGGGFNLNWIAFAPRDRCGAAGHPPERRVLGRHGRPSASICAGSIWATGCSSSSG